MKRTAYCIVEIRVHSRSQPVSRYSGTSLLLDQLQAMIENMKEMLTLGILASKLSKSLLKINLIIISHYKMKY